MFPHVKPLFFNALRAQGFIPPPPPSPKSVGGGEGKVISLVLHVHVVVVHIIYTTVIVATGKLIHLPLIIPSFHGRFSQALSFIHI